MISNFAEGKIDASDGNKNIVRYISVRNLLVERGKDEDKIELSKA